MNLALRRRHVVVTHGCRSTSYTTDTHHAAEVLQTCEAPIATRDVSIALRQDLVVEEVSVTYEFDSDGLVVEHVGACGPGSRGHAMRTIAQAYNIPSKTTPNEPSPIFFPTRKWFPTTPLEVPEDE